MAWYDYLNPTYSAKAFVNSAVDTGKKLGSAIANLNPAVLGNKVGNNIGSAVGQFNSSAVGRQEAFNSAEAQKQRDWEAQMSNTAVQRQVADIKAAGLNPWLAVQGGASGASTPAAASATSNSAFSEAYMMAQTNSTIINSITKLSSSAMQVIASLAKIAAAS